MNSDLESDEERVDKGESDVDYFMDVPSDSELGGDAEGTKRALYDDFFDAAEDEEAKGDETRSSVCVRERERERFRYTCLASFLYHLCRALGANRVVCVHSSLCRSYCR